MGQSRSVSEHCSDTRSRDLRPNVLGALRPLKLMAVKVERRGRLRVPSLALHFDNIEAGRDQSRDGGMPPDERVPSRVTPTGNPR